MRGGKDGPVIHPGEPGKSELFRRVSLPPDNKDFMPADGKPALTAAEAKIIEVWITAGATTQIAETAIQKLPPSPEENAVSPPLTADYRPQMKTIEALEASLGVRLVPRSQNPTDGMILRTASAPERCNDATLAQLAPVANLIVDAELARTKVTDKGLQAIANFSNLRFLDLSDTLVTSAGVKELMKLEKLESLNLTETRVTRDGIAELQAKPGLKRLYSFESTNPSFRLPRANRSCGDSRPRLSGERNSPLCRKHPKLRGDLLRIRSCRSKPVGRRRRSESRFVPHKNAPTSGASRLPAMPQV